MKKRIGVYICHCGGNISDHVDVEEVVRQANMEGEVVLAKDVMFACADSNQKEMVKDIKENNIDAIVVASCSPKLHLFTFRNVAIRAGLNPYNYVQVNIREQCAWAHSDKPKEATMTGIGLVKAGIKRVAQSQELENIEIKAYKTALIIGAGVAGMRAAIALAKVGIEVFLIEKDFFVGGRIAQNDEVFRSNQKGKEIISILYDEIKKSNKITLFTGATVDKVSGTVGNFNVNIKIKPRHIKKCDVQRLNQAMSECKTTVPNDFDFGLYNRKAIYKNYPDALPDLPVIDKDLIINETEILKKYSDCIDLEQQNETIPINAGAVLVTTGFKSYQPKQNEFGYKSIKNVITLPEFKRVIENNDKKLFFNKQEIKNIAFIYCVGGRQKDGPNKYCSRICCTTAIHSSLQLHKKYKNINAFHLYRDIRTYGKYEILYEESSKKGDIYLKFDENEPPTVDQKGNKILVKIKDKLTKSKELELDADLVVLVTGIEPREDHLDIASKLNIPIGNDKFFNEIHPKLRPVETVINGVYIGGTCQAPRNITESIQSSLAGATKIDSLIKDEKIIREPIVAKINPDTCNWCGECEKVCDYDAIKKIEKEGKSIAVVNEGACSGCGACTPVCPSDAIELTNYTNNQIFGMIDGFTNEFNVDETKTDVDTDSSDVKSTILMKEFPDTWEEILKSIKESPKTIPQLSKETDIEISKVTYDIMTMNKYHIIEAFGMDDMDEYYFYKNKN